MQMIYKIVLCIKARLISSNLDNLLILHSILIKRASKCSLSSSVSNTALYMYLKNQVDSTEGVFNKIQVPLQLLLHTAVKLSVFIL